MNNYFNALGLMATGRKDVMPTVDAKMKQIAKNLTDWVDGFLKDAKYLVHDRDPLFTDAFRDIIKSIGV